MLVALSRLSAVAAVFTALVPTISMAQSTTYAYDVLGRLTGVHAGPAITRYDYDAADNRTNVSACNTELPLRRWEAESLPHVIGSAEANGWRADPANGHNAMSYGPYATDIAAGSYVGVWRIKSSQVAPTDTTESITIDAFDSTTAPILPPAPFLVAPGLRPDSSRSCRCRSRFLPRPRVIRLSCAPGIPPGRRLPWTGSA